MSTTYTPPSKRTRRTTTNGTYGADQGSANPYDPNASGVPSPYDPNGTTSTSYTDLPSGPGAPGAAWGTPGFQVNPYPGVDGFGSTATSPKNRLLQAITTPEAITALVSGGLGFAGNALSAGADAKTAAAQRQLQAGLALAQGDSSNLSDLTQRQVAYSNTLQQDPVHQARALFSAGVLRDMAGAGAERVTPGQGPTHFAPSADTQAFLSPTALAENASRFYDAAGQINPYAQHPDLAAAGFGAPGAARQGLLDASITGAKTQRDDLNAQRRKDILDSVGAASSVAGGDTGVNGSNPLQAFDPATGKVLNPNPDPSKYQLDTKTGMYKLKSNHSLLKHILGGVALGASAFIPGLPAVVAPALFGAGLSYGAGGSIKQAAGGAAIGAASSAANDYFNRGKA